MTKLHYIYDEELKVEREYVEVGRKADVGEYVHVTEYAEDSLDAIALISHIDEYDDIIAYDIRVDDWRYDLSEYDVFSALEPTGNVRIGGNLYKLADRQAKVGERVIIINCTDSYGMYGKGNVFSAEYSGEIGIENAFCSEDKFNPNGLISHEEYQVLEPVDQSVLDETLRKAPEDKAPYPPYTYEDLVANLVRRVGRLEKQLAEVSEQSTINKRNIETFAEDFTEYKAGQGNENRLVHENIENLKEKVDMLTVDVVLLDERTQPEAMAETVRREEALQTYVRGGGCACHRNCR